MPLTRKLALFKEMDEEFGKKMKVAINNLPPDYTENVSQKKLIIGGTKYKLETKQFALYRLVAFLKNFWYFISSLIFYGISSFHCVSLFLLMGWSCEEVIDCLL